MALPIRWAPKAARQLEEIVDYIAEDSPRSAAIFARQVMQSVRVIPANPKIGRMVPEYGDPSLRERSCRASASSTASLLVPSKSLPSATAHA
jgi:plasmid stabilization system protein ParE